MGSNDKGNKGDGVTVDVEFRISHGGRDQVNLQYTMGVVDMSARLLQNVISSYLGTMGRLGELILMLKNKVL